MAKQVCGEVFCKCFVSYILTVLFIQSSTEDWFIFLSVNAMLEILMFIVLLFNTIFQRFRTITHKIELTLDTAFDS